MENQEEQENHKEKVFLFGKGKDIGRRAFDIDHAERCLELQKKTPPKVWTLDDDAYEYKGGKLIKKTVSSGGTNEGGSNSEDLNS